MALQALTAGHAPGTWGWAYAEVGVMLSLSRCPSTGFASDTTIKFQSSSSLGLRPFMLVCVLPLPDWMKVSLPKATSLIASGGCRSRWSDAGCLRRRRRGCWLSCARGRSSSPNRQPQRPQIPLRNRDGTFVGNQRRQHQLSKACRA